MVCQYPCCGGRTRTGDLQVMGLASCQLLYPAINQFAINNYQLRILIRNFKLIIDVCAPGWIRTIDPCLIRAMLYR